MLADAELVGVETHEMAFGAHTVEEHHQLHLEEDHRINGWDMAPMLGHRGTSVPAAKTHLVAAARRIRGPVGSIRLNISFSYPAFLRLP
ncbi:MAG: hypothetical protein ACLQUY_03460 [Ktedonobacterales bacterium]